MIFRSAHKYTTSRIFHFIYDAHVVSYYHQYCRDILNSEHLLITSPEALADIFVRKVYHFEKPHEIRQFTAHILGVGLLTSEGDAHKSD